MKFLKGAFIIYGRRGGGELEGGGENFATYCRGEGGPTFFSILFWRGDFF